MANTISIIEQGLKNAGYQDITFIKQEETNEDVTAYYFKGIDKSEDDDTWTNGTYDNIKVEEVRNSCDNGFYPYYETHGHWFTIHDFIV